MARTSLPRSFRVPALAAAGIASVAPASSAQLRVGLADRAPAARISAPQPFVLRAGALVIEVSEALVSPETGAGRPVLALGSFASEAMARQAAAAFREQRRGDATVRLDRHPETGRYLAVLPGAVAKGKAERLRAEGFLSAGVFDLPAATGDALVVRPLAGSPIRIPGGVSLTAEPPAAGFLEWEAKPYRGVFTILRSGDGVTVVNRLELEDYLRGVVPSELPPDLFPEPEALKAQALAARTYALRPREAYRERGYDLCSGATCQVYGGVAAEHPLASAAVRDTAGEVLYHQGRLIEALYTAACGGSTENAENVFSTPTPYLVARACLRETGGQAFRSAGPIAPLDAAIAGVAGALPGGWEGTALGEPASRTGALRVVGAAVRWLGLPRCEPPTGTGAGLTLGEFARLVETIRCRDPRSGGAAGLVGESPASRLLAEGLLDPGERGLDPERKVSRREVAGVAARLLRREASFFRRGQVRETGAGVLTVEPDGNGPADRKLLQPAPEARFFREIRPTRIPGRGEPLPLPVPVAELRLRVGDFVRYRELPGASDDSGDADPMRFDVLILEDLGEAQDRFSRQSSWLVPKNNRDLSAAVAGEKPIGRIVALEPLEYGPSGRIVRLRIRGTEGELEVRGLRIRRLLGLSENLFFAEPRRDEGGAVTEWWFSGRGWGHGLGLCQAGAYGMAAAGADYREILAHYYPGVEVASVR